MSKLSNKDLDRLFREGTEQYDPLDVKPEAWKQMEALLERQRRRRLFFWWLLGGLLVITAGTGIICRQKAGEKAWNRTDAVEQATPPQPAPPVAEGRPPAASTEPAGSSRDTQEVGVLPREEPASRVAVGKTEPLPADPERKKITALAFDGAALRPAASPEHAGPVEETGKTGGKTATPENRLPASVPPALPLLSSAVRMDRPGWELPVLPVLTAAEAWLPPPADSLPNGALTFGLTGAPEFSAAGGSPPGPVHLRGGLMVELRYARNFSVSTGLLLSNKKYSAGEGAYNAPTGFWTYKIAPSNTDGECTVLEVPLNVGYFLRHHSTNSLFFEAGISNFFMLEEHYWYSYDDPTPGLIKYWAAENENRHFLAVLNLAPGYQWQPSKWLGLQVSPYAQIPIAGVGHGKVALYSFGVNLRVNLTPLAWQ